MLGSTPKNESEMHEQLRLCKATNLKCVLGGPAMRPATDTCHGSIAGEGSFAGPGTLDPKTLPPPDDNRPPPHPPPLRPLASP